jgi:hypothetical protein
MALGPPPCGAQASLRVAAPVFRLEQDGQSDSSPSMRDTSLLQPAPALTPPWTVCRADFDAEAHRLDIPIDFPPRQPARLSNPRRDAAVGIPEEGASTAIRHVTQYSRTMTRRSANGRDQHHAPPALPTPPKQRCSAELKFRTRVYQSH